MPYAWTQTSPEKTLRLWPHQSMTARGFVWFIGVTAGMLALPLLAAMGSPAIWFLLAFFTAVLAGVWHAIMRNKADREIYEELRIGPENMQLDHVPSAGPPLKWHANPFWVQVNLRQDGPVENYLTLRGNGREVELGAFLTPEERQALYDELRAALAR